MPPYKPGPDGSDSFVCRLRDSNVQSKTVIPEWVLVDEAAVYRLRAVLSGLLRLTAQAGIALDAVDSASAPATRSDQEKGDQTDG